MSRIVALTKKDDGDQDPAHAELPHVLLVLDQFPKTLGGGERIVLRLAALLPQYGYRASILTFYVHPETTGLGSPPCPIYLLPLTRTYDLSALRAAGDLRRFLKQQKVRIVETFFESSDLWAGLVAKTSAGVKLVWSRRDMGILRSRKHTIAYRWMASAPDAVFAVSDGVRRHCIEVDGIAPGRVTTIYNGVDVADRPKDDRPDAGCRNGAGAPEQSRAVLVTTVGNIRRVKGHDVLLRAAALVRARFPDTSFRVAGAVLEPSYFEELQDLVRELNLSSHFQFLGGVTDLEEQFGAADIFVLPSRSEGFSNAIIEAMAASLPVVATDVGGNAEAVQDGVNGFIVPAEDPEALAGAMMQLLADSPLARRMGFEGRRLADERFTTAAMMRKRTSVYEALLRDG